MACGALGDLLRARDGHPGRLGAERPGARHRLRALPGRQPGARAADQRRSADRCDAHDARRTSDRARRLDPRRGSAAHVRCAGRGCWRDLRAERYRTWTTRRRSWRGDERRRRPAAPRRPARALPLERGGSTKPHIPTPTSRAARDRRAGGEFLDSHLGCYPPTAASSARHCATSRATSPALKRVAVSSACASIGCARSRSSDRPVADHARAQPAWVRARSSGAPKRSSISAAAAKWATACS